MDPQADQAVAEGFVCSLSSLSTPLIWFPDWFALDFLFGPLQTSSQSFWGNEERFGATLRLI